MQEEDANFKKYLPLKALFGFLQTIHTGLMGTLVTFDCESIYLGKCGISHKPYLKSLKDTIFSLIIFVNKSFLH